jgi:isoleucyl-tRNA synthetase
MPEVPDSKNLKSTLNLPKTDFAMKANLPQNEPTRLAKWDAEDLYGKIRATRAGSPKYILHDGPPYANGAIHLGHALNKCIKDFVVKTKTMAGFDSPYVPGWDCHGLPIEIKVDEQLGGKKLSMDPVEVRKACREYAAKYVDLQRSQFKRLGVFGRWDKPYETMNFATKRRSSKPSTASTKRTSSTRALNPSTGAHTTTLHSLKLKSSTRCTPRPRSTCATS